MSIQQIEFASLAKRDRDRYKFDAKHSSKRAKRFLAPINPKKGSGK